MKNLRLVLPLILLIFLALVFTGCKGIVPSPGATEDDTTVSGQIFMPYCCLLLEEMEKDVEKSKYSGYDCYDETDAWRPAPGAMVELRKYDDCKVKYTTTTDENGNYEFTEVKPGLYVLTTYCPTDEDYFLKDVIEKKEGIALDAGIPDCDSTSLAFVIEYIGDTYCHCEVICPCFNEKWSKEFKLVKKIAESDEVNMEVNIPAIIAHKDFGTLCNVDSQGNLIDDDLVDLVCAKLQSCCVSPGATGGGGGGETTTYNLTLLVNPEGAGTVTGAGNYNAGVTRDISATAISDCYTFVNWTINTGNPGAIFNLDLANTQVLMNGNITLTANFENTGPTADANGDYEDEAVCGSTAANVTLDGTGSTAGGSAIETYEWFEGTTSLGTGFTLDYYFAPGSHTVTLVVTDENGCSDEDTASVTINEVCVCCKFDFFSGEGTQKAKWTSSVVQVQYQLKDVCPNERIDLKVEVYYKQGGDWKLYGTDSTSFTSMSPNSAGNITTGGEWESTNINRPDWYESYVWKFKFTITESNGYCPVYSKTKEGNFEK